ncbi:hypothetical protein CLAIMM_14925 isoform 2 [Cladophialophora immunda]|nr:hypothetical protein CLAIMM_14925 isoform 2 [Cladophialophora immunda]
MDMQAERMGRGIDLMGDDSAGIFCSEEVMGSSDTMTGDQLRRFIHHQEALQNPRLIGYGRQAVMVLATSKGVEYVFKVFKKWEETGPVFAASYREAVEASPFAKECRAFGRLDSLKRNVRDDWESRRQPQYEPLGYCQGTPAKAAATRRRPSHFRKIRHREIGEHLASRYSNGEL